MTETKTKLIHYSDLSGNDLFYLLIDNGESVRQLEINRHEYVELKSAENGHYINELSRIKEKYKSIEGEII